MELLEAFLTAAVRVATPLLLAALGEAVSERGGVINLGLEGSMLAGALGATLGASAIGPFTGLGVALLAGAALAGVFALVAVRLRANQIISGTAITLAAVGLTGAIYRGAYGPGGVGLSLPTLQPVPVPLLSAIPILGPAFFNQAILTYASYALVVGCWWLLFRTGWGLQLRAAGEGADQARAAGVPVARLRVLAVLLAGALAGLAGGSLVLAQVGTFAERMTAGRGFIAIAIVILGAWHPVRIAGAALFFGGAMALQFLFQGFLEGIPYQLFLMLPYVLTLLVLAGAWGRSRAPAELGRG